METALQFWLHPGLVLPDPANEDRVVLGPLHTPASALREAWLTKQWLQRKLRRQPGLLWDAGWRFSWNATLALERCVTWRYFEQRWPWR